MNAGFRVDALVMRLLVQIALIGAFSLLILLGMAICVGVAEAGGPPEPRAAVLAAALFAVILPLALGAWLTAGFAHLNRARVWMWWTLWVIALWIAALLLRALMLLLDPSDANTALDEIGLAVFASAPALAFLFWTMIFAGAGIPLGLLLLRGAGGFHRLRRRLRRRARRAALHSR